MAARLTPPSPEPDRLAYLDGLRGIAAMVVVCEHAIGGRLPALFGPVGLGWGELLLWPLTLGLPMVYLFITLSGFGLAHGELARRERGRATSVAAFARRRAWRILPTYYAAIALSLASWAACRAIAHQYQLPGDGWIPLTRSGLLAHLLLVHDYYQNWLTQVAPPLWSIAVEVQLYFAFPLVFWALGRFPPVLVAAAPLALLGVAWPNLALIFLAHLGPWFVAGMAAAKLAFTGHARRWLAAAGLLAGGVVAVAGLGVFQGVPGVQAVWAVAVLGLLLGLYRAPAAWWNVPTWPVAREVGRWSYSLYVAHFPVLALLELTLGRLVPDPTLKAYAMLAVGIPASCLAARALYELVERPSLARMQGRPTPPAVEVAA
jgi:peptidoglycan/LPS O-acetylase OafA/YrhL